MPSVNAKVDKSIAAGRYRDAASSAKVWELKEPLKILDFDTEDELKYGLDRYGRRRTQAYSDASREEGETSSSYDSDSATSRSGSSSKPRSGRHKDRVRQPPPPYAKSAHRSSKKSRELRRSSSDSGTDQEPALARGTKHNAAAKSAEELRKLQRARELGLAVGGTRAKTLEELEAVQAANADSFLACKTAELTIDSRTLQSRAALKLLGGKMSGVRQRR